VLRRVQPVERVGTPVTIIQITMLALVPSLTLVALLLCKPAVRSTLTLYKGDDPDLVDEQPLVEPE
jgi:hypothetical protein